MKIHFDFDPEEESGVTVPRSRKAEARAAVADYVREEVLSTVGGGASPVAGEKWKRDLSPKYKAKKAKFSSAGFANMELHGDLLDSVEVVVKGSKLRLKVGEDQNDKADGHCNFSGKSKLPRRRFIPNGKEGQTFKRNIIDGIRDVLVEFTEG